MSNGMESLMNYVYIELESNSAILLCWYSVVSSVKGNLSCKWNIFNINFLFF